jgi:hypothetical protein
LNSQYESHAMEADNYKKLVEQADNSKNAK